MWNNCPLGRGFESNMYSPVTLKEKKRFLNKSEVLSLVSFNAKWLHASELLQLLYYMAELKKRSN